MPLRRTLFVICLLLLLFCLAAGYAIAGKWIGALIAILLGPAWWLAKKYPVAPLAFVCLSGSVGLAVVGTLIGAASVWMIFGSALALAAWDLVLLDSSLRNQSSVEQTRPYESQHIQSLMLALGSALVTTVLGRFFTFQIPFMVLILLIALILFALDRAWSAIKKTGRS